MGLTRDFALAKKRRKKRKRQESSKAPKSTAPPPPGIPPMTPVPTHIGCWERVKGILTIVSLLLAFLGLVTLVELSPRLSASAKNPFHPADQIASFAIRNDGYLKVTNVQPGCFIWNLTKSGKTVMRNVYSEQNGEMESADELSPAETLTVPCGIRVRAPIESVDLGVVIYYRPWPFTIFNKRRVFRFVAKPGEDGTLNWYEQPSADLEEALDEFLQKLSHH
jgi:hypothetical protein